MKKPDLAYVRKVTSEVLAGCPWSHDWGSVLDADGRVLFHAMDWGSEKFVAAMDPDTVRWMLDRIAALENGLTLALQIVGSVEQCIGIDAIYDAKGIEQSKENLQKLVTDAAPIKQPSSVFPA